MTSYWSPELVWNCFFKFTLLSDLWPNVAKPWSSGDTRRHLGPHWSTSFLASGSCRERRRGCSSLSLSRSALSSPSLLSLLFPSRRSELDCVRNARTHARIASCYRLYFPSVLMIFLFPSFINLLGLSFVSEIDPGEKELCNNQSQAASLELLSLCFPFLFLFWFSGSLVEEQY